MGDTVEYDEDEAKREEAIYRSAAAAERRQLVRDLLALGADESVLSIGCGPGFEPVECAPVVGDAGEVVGIDRSGPMLGLARERCRPHESVTIAAGDAAALPVASASVDAAAAVQVYEYLDAVQPAIDELARVLKPGGRAVICDADFRSLVWRSTDSDRMAKVLEAFDDHCPRPRLGSNLRPHLRSAGLAVERVEPNTIVNTSLDEDTFAGQLQAFVRHFVADHDAIGPDVAEAWADDLQRQDAAGETFFSFTQYAHLVSKPE